MPKFCVGDKGITLRLQLPKGQVWPSGATVQFKLLGQQHQLEVANPGTISSNTTTFACVDYTLTGNEGFVPDAYEAQAVCTNSSVSIGSQSPHPVWVVEPRL